MKRHHAVVRITHWVNVIALTIMIGSGLRIFNAYPAFARRGETFCCYPFEHQPIPASLTFGGWLAGARNWHFAMMWVLGINGLIYLAFIYLHGEWRDLVPRRGIVRDAREMVRFYLTVRKDHPRQGKHNALQRLAYFAMPIVGILAVVTGIAIWKPVQLAPLTNLLGGYVWARYWHFWSMLLLVALIMVMGRGPLQVCVALGVTGWVGFCRITRGETLKIRELEFVQAARALGASTPRILLTHILPNLAHLVLITFVLMFSGLVLSEAILSWLGIGIDGSWGQMIDQARDELARDPVIVWNLAAASAALFALILSVNIVGDALRDVLDPRTLRERR